MIGTDSDLFWTTFFLGLWSGFWGGGGGGGGSHKRGFPLFISRCVAIQSLRMRNQAFWAQFATDKVLPRLLGQVILVKKKSRFGTGNPVP